MTDNTKTLTADQTCPNDFFQVSISSKKLMLILKKLEDNYAHLLTKIQTYNDNFKESQSILNKKIIHLEENTNATIQNEVEQLKTSIQNDFRKSQEKYIKELHQKESRLNELKYSIQTLNDKINKVNTSLTEEIQNSVRNLSMENFALKRTIEQTQQTLNSQFEQLFQKLETYKSDIRNNKQNIFQLEVKLKKYTEIALRPEDCERILIPEKKFEESINAEKYGQFSDKQKENLPIYKSKYETLSPSKEKDTSKSKRSGKRSIYGKSSPIKKSRLFRPSNFAMKQPTQNYLTTLQYASISAKVENLQKVIKQKVQNNNNNNNNNNNSSNEDNEDFVQRRTKNNLMKTFSYSKQQFERLMKTKDGESLISQMNPCEIVERIFYKLQMIEKSFQEKQILLNKSIQEMKQKLLVSSEKMDFMKQKIAKANSDNSEIKIKLQTIEKKSGQGYGSGTISGMQNQLGKLIQRFDHQSQIKLDVEEYEKQKAKLAQKIALVQQNLAEKAEKVQVKKAIAFLEDKIKEIILLIANQYNIETSGAISKQPVKCLTCDKGILELNSLARSNGFRGISTSKSTRDLSSKYFTRLVKSKKQNRTSAKAQNNYTTVTQVTQMFE